LSNNRPPSDLEKGVITADIAQRVISLRKIDKQIEYFRNQLEACRANKDTLRRTIEVRMSVLSPLRALPAELLSDIFTRSLPDDDFIPAVSISMPLVPSWTYWRQVALSTSRLWRTVMVVVKKKSQLKPKAELLEQ
ncbi:hypothetical protein NEOLEDRAFT_1077219, partial [Neolentinus lepideus HHB14362 ss-1]